jgi:ribokinase
MITVIGSLNLDMVVYAKKIPRPGETVMGKNFKQVPGGKGGNQADASAKLGADVVMIGCIGNDVIGTMLKNSLKTDGVNVDSVLINEEEATGIAAIVVEDSGNNAITVVPGANYKLRVQDIESLSAIIKRSKVILLQLEVPIESVRASLKIGRESGAVTILNPAPAAELDEEIYRYAEILTPNESELEVLTGHNTETLEQVEAAGKILVGKGTKEIIVTLGQNGCMHINKYGAMHYKAYKVKAVDTTAAGDGFNGALAVSIDEGNTIEEAIKFAMKVGAMIVTREGAQTSLPLKKEIDAFDIWLTNNSKGD